MKQQHGAACRSQWSRPEIVEENNELSQLGGVFRLNKKSSAQEVGGFDERYRQEQEPTLMIGK